MCGIVGYIGDRDIVPVLLGGLKKLEYRGYDSAGVAYVGDKQLEVVKTKGRLSALEALMQGRSRKNTAGIGHTRWATHGEPSDVNSHPHTNMAGDLAVAHNGIIENYKVLKEWLQGKGVRFVSDTDTEVAAHLINYYYDADLKSAVLQAARMLKGSYALAVVSQKEPDRIVAIRKDSPLVVGLGENENLLASDIPALLEYTRKVYFLEDNEVAVLKKNKVEIFNAYGTRVQKEPYTVDWDVAQAEKGGFEHFMIKEISEEPRALADTLNPRVKEGRIDLSDVGINEEMVKEIKKIIIVACGTAYHAGCVGKSVIERLCRIPVEVDIASEFRYRDPIFLPGTFVMIISQSGETADTIAAMREAKRNGCRILAITNVVGSTVAREADAIFYTRAGMEIAVASTKAYITQLLALYMLALELAYFSKTIAPEEHARLLDELLAIPQKAEEVVAQKEAIQKFASKRFMEHSMFFMGRGLDYALAMEGSLKLKEISYIHSEAYAAGELKHGTIALIESNTLVMAVATQRALLEKLMSNVKEVKARGAFVAAVVQKRSVSSCSGVDELFIIPDVEDLFAPLLAVIPMQMFAYYVAISKGCDVDKPRNLAKSVTVE